MQRTSTPGGWSGQDGTFWFSWMALYGDTRSLCLFGLVPATTAAAVTATIDAAATSYLCLHCCDPLGSRAMGQRPSVPCRRGKPLGRETNRGRSP